ncbi:MAG: hypothetical protein IPM92_15835 [Saprospiraceae bacterium]|nr:hypothetical protein [Saprospiraceae bacterium]
MSKNHTGIWLDSKEAFVLKTTTDGRSTQHIHSDIETHERIKGEGKEYTRLGSVYIDPEKTHENRREHQAQQYFEKIAHELQDVDEFIVFGPAQMKQAFSSWIEEHRDFQKKLTATLTTDKMTENQIFDFIQDYYQKN